MSDQFDEPRPVFQGDWQSATGVEKGKHSQRVREWTARRDAAEAAKAQSQAGSGFVQPATSVRPDATLAVLRAIRDDASAHDSDRISAAKAITSMEREEAATAHGPSPLVALRQCLDLLQPHERLAWLQGERIAHIGAGEGGA